MALDNYALCPCGSGKKVKWCSPKVLTEIQRDMELADKGQGETALRLLHKAAEQHPEPRCLRMYIETNIATIEMMEGKHEEGFDRLKRTADDYPEAGLPCNVLSMLFGQFGDAEQAVKYARQALDRFPAEAAPMRSNAALQLTAGALQMGSPIAAIAAWQQGLKIDPGLAAGGGIDEQLKKYAYLPRFVKAGLALRSPDEFAMFNDERREKWDKALGGERAWKLEDAAAAFEALLADDASDLGARYNLAVVYAWLGRNADAYRVLDDYVRLETDDRAAAAAWEVALVLCQAQDMAERSDHTVRRVEYAIRDLQAFDAAGDGWRHLVAFGQGNERHMMTLLADRPLPDRKGEGSETLIGSQPHYVARWSGTEGVVQLEVFDLANVETAKRIVAERFGNTLELVEEWSQVSAFPWQLFQPVLVARAPASADTPEAVRAFRTRAAEEYYETTWIAEPLRTLGNLAPRDAAGSKVMRRKLEAAVRREEAYCRLFGLEYNHDRLRNKLGLMSLLPAGVRSEDSPLPISSYSAAQLAELDPHGLDDERLLEAYGAANAHDIPVTALGFAKELVKRGGLATKIDMIAVFRRLTIDRLEHRKYAGAVEFVDAALAYDAAHYARANAGAILALKARSLAAEGQNAQAADVYRQIMLEHPKQLKYGVEAVEAALRNSDWRLAKELAELGLKRAQELRERALQEQFRELGREAAARAR